MRILILRTLSTAVSVWDTPFAEVDRIPLNNVGVKSGAWEPVYHPAWTLNRG